MDYYKILEVDSKASKGVIRAAYQTLFDLYKDNPSKTKELDLAVSVLQSDTKRQRYDNEKNTLTGKIVDKYRILSVIAEGGFGKTYKAEHVEKNLPVCIKHAFR